MPCIALIGNHDCLATGQEVFQRIFGETNFAFTAGDTRFICLNTNAMEYDYSVPVPDFDFMEHQLTHLPPGVVRAVWVMHVRPGEFQFNNNVKKAFEYYILRSPGLPFCLYGHEHTARVDDLFGDGVLYYQCPDIGKRTYLLFTMHETGYEYETVVFLVCSCCSGFRSSPAGAVRPPTRSGRKGRPSTAVCTGGARDGSASSRPTSRRNTPAAWVSSPWVSAGTTAANAAGRPT